MTLGNSRLRIGAVRYLNTEPLIAGLERYAAEIEIVKSTPRRLAEFLAEGRLDAALIPVVEVLRTGSWPIVPGVCIGCDGPVRSVALHSKFPIPEIASLLLDRSSMTSALLAQTLLISGYDRSPRAEISAAPLHAGHDFAQDPHDAFVIIGDEALRLRQSILMPGAAAPRNESAAPNAPASRNEPVPQNPAAVFPHSMDLGEEWKRQTGLPFVFAVWALAAPPAKARPLARLLRSTMRKGIEHIDEITPKAALQRGLRPEVVRDYLGGAIRYEFGALQRRALEEFGARLLAQGLLRQVHPIQILEGLEE